MPFFTGFAGEFGRQLGESRRLEADRAERNAALENSILQHLSTSQDPEIASRAVAGLLSQAGPGGKGRRAKGLQGFLGETEANPHLPMLRDFIGAGSGQTGGGGGSATPTPAAVPGSAAQPTTSVQTPAAAAPLGTGPATPAQATAQGTSAAGTAAGTAAVPMIGGPPRRVFRTPDEQIRLDTAARRQGDLDTIRQTRMSPREQLLVYGRTAIPPRNVPGLIQDEAGQWFREQETYDIDTGAWTRQQFPTAAPAGLVGTGQTVQETRIGEDGRTHRYNVFYPRAGGPAQVRGVNDPADAVMTRTNPDQSQDPVQVPRTFPTPAGVAGGPPATPGGATVAPATSRPPARTARPAGGPGATGAPQGGPPVAAPARSAASAAAPPPRTGALGRKRDLQPVEGAFLGPNGEPVEGHAFLDKGLGQYFDATNPALPAQGFIPGEMGAYAVQAYNAANQTLLTIEAAQKALVDKGLVQIDGNGHVTGGNNDPAAIAKLSQQFYTGTLGTDPLGAAAASLTNLAGLQGATQYVRSNSRSYQMFQQALVHLPRVPSERVANLTQIPAGGQYVTPGTAGTLGSHGWDSALSMYRKLESAKSVIQNGKGALTALTGKTPDRAVGAAPGAAAAGTTPAGATPPPGGPPAPVQTGERRRINGQEAEWDGQGWVAVAPAPAAAGGRGRGGR